MIAGLAVAVLSGCAATDDRAAGGSATTPAPAAAGSPSPAPSVAAAPAPTAPAPLPDVPRTDAGLSANQPPVTIAPVRVEVPSLGIDVDVVAEGLAGDGTLALPADPGVASWYRFGPSPWSASGATVIAAHVDSFEYGLGQFARLTDAAAGTPVTVTGVDGSVATFAVASVELLEKTAVPWATVFDRSGEPRLTLVTCGGEFDYSTGHYLSNVIVTATPTG
jgi:hypothetical protein